MMGLSETTEENEKIVNISNSLNNELSDSESDNKKSKCFQYCMRAEENECFQK